MKPSREALNAAANWWADRISRPTFDNLGPTRGRDPRETEINTFASLLAGIAATQSGAPSASQIDAFKEALVAAIDDAEWFPNSLCCDYGPDQLLAGAAQKAGIATSRFPWKSGTWFRDGNVEAACGYGAPHEVIYQAEPRAAGEGA